MAKQVCVLRNSGSIYPVDFTVIQEDAGWSTVYPLGRTSPNVYIHTCELAASGSKVLLGAWAPNPSMEVRLTAFASASPQAWTWAELLADTTPAALKIKAYLPQVSGSIALRVSTITGHDYPGRMERGE